MEITVLFMSKIVRNTIPLSLLLVAVACMVFPAAAYHIPTVDEGLLSQEGCYIGAYLGGNSYTGGPDGGHETWIRDPSAFNTATGKNHRLFSRYVSLGNVLNANENRDGLNTTQWAETIITTYDAVPVIFLVPWDSELDLSHKYTGADGKTAQQHIDEFATQLSGLSGNGQNTIIIVFGHEMESQAIVQGNPAGYTGMFRYAAGRFHEAGCLMAWCTNVNDNPFNPPQQIIYWPGSENPTYPGPKPGKEYVDWVAQTRYHFWWGANTFSGLKGEYQSNPQQSWYNYFGNTLGLPLMFAETAGQRSENDPPNKWYPNPLNKDTQDFSAEWIPKLYDARNLRTGYPKIKAIIWFDTLKSEGGSSQNYLIPPGAWNGTAVSPLTGTLYTNGISDPYFLGDVKTEGDGEGEGDGPTGSLYVSTIPIGMSVTLDRVPAGKTPQTFNGIAAGMHTVALLKEGYLGEIAFVDVKPGETTVLFSRLEPLNGSIMLTSEPPGASVLLDGRSVGVTPVTLDNVTTMMPHTLRAEKDGYTPWVKNVSATGGQTTYLLALLRPATGRLRVLSSPDKAEVRVNGTLSGSTPVVIRKLQPGNYLVEIRKTGYIAYQETVTVTAGNATIVNAGLFPASPQ